MLFLASLGHDRIARHDALRELSAFGTRSLLVLVPRTGVARVGQQDNHTPRGAAGQRARSRGRRAANSAFGFSNRDPGVPERPASANMAP